MEGACWAAVLCGRGAVRTTSTSASAATIRRDGVLSAAASVARAAIIRLVRIDKGASGARPLAGGEVGRAGLRFEDSLRGRRRRIVAAGAAVAVTGGSPIVAAAAALRRCRCRCPSDGARPPSLADFALVGGELVVKGTLLARPRVHLLTLLTLPLLLAFELLAEADNFLKLCAVSVQ